MEFAVIGDTVNRASRLEGLTRIIDTDLIVSGALTDRVCMEAGGGDLPILEGLEDAGEREVKGRSEKIPILALRRPDGI